MRRAPQWISTTVHMHHHLMFRDWNDPTDSLCSVRTTRALACTGAFRVRNRLRLFFDYAMLVLGELDLNYGRLCAFLLFRAHHLFVAGGPAHRWHHSHWL